MINNAKKQKPKLMVTMVPNRNAKLTASNQPTLCRIVFLAIETADRPIALRPKSQLIQKLPKLKLAVKPIEGLMLVIDQWLARPVLLLNH